MPVKVSKRGSTYRVVEANGRIAKTPKGNARDGGGHSSRGKAQAQAKAINRNSRRK